MVGKVVGAFVWLGKGNQSILYRKCNGRAHGIEISFRLTFLHFKSGTYLGGLRGTIIWGCIPVKVRERDTSYDVIPSVAGVQQFSSALLEWTEFRQYCQSSWLAKNSVCCLPAVTCVEEEESEEEGGGSLCLLCEPVWSAASLLTCITHETNTSHC